MNNPDTLAGRLYWRRNGLGLSQKDLGREAGISDIQISRYERGENLPRGETAIRLAKALKVATEWLVNGDTPAVEPAKAPRQRERAVVNLPNLPVPAELYDSLVQAAEASKRSMEAEIVTRLQNSFTTDVSERIDALEASVLDMITPFLSPEQQEELRRNRTR